MKQYLIFSGSEFRRRVSLRPERLASQLEEGEEAVEAPEDLPSISTHKITRNEEGVIEATPRPPPAPPATIESLLAEYAQTGTEPPALRDKMLKKLAARRYEVETSGVTLGSFTIPSDPRSQGLITASYIKAQTDPTFIKRWKITEGQWVEIDQATMIAVGDAVFAHVDACFSREAELSDLIAAATTAQELSDLLTQVEEFFPPQQ